MKTLLLLILFLILYCIIIKFKRETKRETTILFESVYNLADQIKELTEEPDAGEIFHKDKWKPFKDSDIEDHHNMEYKIGGIWHNAKNIVFYSRIYDNMKEKIEND